MDANTDFADADRDLADAERNVADADTTSSSTQVSAKREEMTVESRKLHNKKFLVFQEDKMGGAFCINERDQKCITSKLWLGHLKGRDGLM